MKEKITEVIAVACQELFAVEPVVTLERPEEQFGDFATNVAMQLAKPVGRAPREIALALSEKMQASSLFSSVGVAGPGFINMTLTDDSLTRMMLEKPAKILTGLKVLVEYSDPNPFKPLHAGHLYTTIVGDVIARLTESAGAETARLNYGGDVGLHVGKTMWAIIQHVGGENPDKVKAIPVDHIGSWLGERYAEGHLAYEDDEDAQAHIVAVNKKVYSLHEQDDHESAFAQIYWYLRDVSYESFKKLYQRLDVNAFDRFIPESEVTPLGVQTVAEQTEKGVFEKSNGAIIFDGEQHGLFTNVFINSEGLPTYSAKDVGLSLMKWQDYRFDESIIITANEQSQYMEVVIKAIEQFAPEPAQRTRHVTHGILKMQGGVKMSSRKGNVLMASDILDAAEVAGKESGQAVEHTTVLAAVKYGLLKNRVGGDIIYNPKESVATEGNSGPYIQYAHARACSIMHKLPHIERLNETSTFDPSERTLARKLGEFTEVLELATVELEPHHICTYLYELAQTFNRFYENNRVIGNPRQSVRAGLIQQYIDVLKNGLNMLGIHAPEKM